MTESALTLSLAKSIRSQSWSELEPFYLNDKLFIVEAELDLVTVACALIEDDRNLVDEWLSDGWLYPPLKEEVTEWSNGTFELQSLIVPPYCLVLKGE
jgi:hypothetical protein